MLRILLLLTSLFTFFILAAQNDSYIVHFDVDKYSITASESEKLSEYLESLDFQKVERIALFGHTDSDGSNQYNETLSRNRTDEIAKNILDANFGSALDTSSFGELKPLNTNKSKGEKTENRRVEIRVYFIPEIIEETGDIQELYALLEQEKEEFCIANQSDTFIVLRQGTIIQFPKNAFGSDTSGCITIRAKECYEMSDMVLENLSTTSNGAILETEGMIYLEALTLTGDTIGLAPGKEITVFMPTDEIRGDVRIFDGARDPHTNVMNWTLNNLSAISGIPASAMNDCFRMNDLDDRMSCSKCNFWCRLGRFGRPFMGMIDRGTRSDNRSFRRCQRALRKNGGVVSPPGGFNPDGTVSEVDCASLDSLLEAYGVDNQSDLVMAMNKPLMDSLGVSTLDELRVALKEIKDQKLASDLEAGGGTVTDLQYYVFNRAKLGWINIDAFSKLDGKRITMTTDLPAKSDSDCKAVFKRVKGILPGQHMGDVFGFTNVPRGNSIWLIGLRYKGGNAYLSMEQTTVMKITNPIKLKKVSIQELKAQLRKINP